MKRMGAKLTVGFVVVLLCSAAGATVKAQSAHQVSINLFRNKATSRIKVLAGALRADTAAPQYQELRCRGGAGLRFVLVEGRTNSSGEQTMYMTVYFHPATQPSGGSGRNLQPGQCAFPERAVRRDEPNEIIQEIVNFGQLAQTRHGTPVDTSLAAAERFPDAQNVPQYLGDSKHYWSFFVRQNGPLPSGRFEASTGRYWKPAVNVEGAIRPSDSQVPNKQRYPSVLIPKKPE